MRYDKLNGPLTGYRVGIYKSHILVNEIRVEINRHSYTAMTPSISKNKYRVYVAAETSAGVGPSVSVLLTSLWIKGTCTTL